MDDSPSSEQLALELLLSVAISGAVALAFAIWLHPLAYAGLGVVVGVVLLGRRYIEASPEVPRWLPLAILPVDAMLWPTAVVGDILRARSLELQAQEEEKEASRSEDPSSSDDDTKHDQ